MKVERVTYVRLSCAETHALLRKAAMNLIPTNLIPKGAKEADVTFNIGTAMEATITYVVKEPQT